MIGLAGDSPSRRLAKDATGGPQSQPERRRSRSSGEATSWPQRTTNAGELPTCALLSRPRGSLEAGWPGEAKHSVTQPRDVFQDLRELLVLMDLGRHRRPARRPAFPERAGREIETVYTLSGFAGRRVPSRPWRCLNRTAALTQVSLRIRHFRHVGCSRRRNGHSTARIRAKVAYDCHG